MSDLAAWAKKHGFDLEAHLERSRQEGVLSVERRLEADHHRRMRKLDAEIKASGLMDEITVEGDASEATAPYAGPGPAGHPDGGAPALHLRYDDSRPRGLASECICGEPGCTRWYEP